MVPRSSELGDAILGTAVPLEHVDEQNFPFGSQLSVPPKEGFVAHKPATWYLEQVRLGSSRDFFLRYRYQVLWHDEKLSFFGKKTERIIY